jgi:peptide/nickel transport system permease protein
MLTYVIRRLLLMLVTIWGVMTILFGLQLFAGDPTLTLLPPDATEQVRQSLAHELGLDQPLPVRYLDFLWHTLTGNLGLSWKFNQPALAIILDALPMTALLTVAALALGLLVAVPLGVLAAVRRNTWIDTVASFVAVLGQSMPVYWSGLLLILLFSTTLRLLPSMGASSPAAIILPAAALGLSTAAGIERITRASMLEVLGQDYIRTSRAKGLPERLVLLRHALRNAAAPIVSLIGLNLGALLGGAVLTETVFAWPGVGRLAVNAVYARDFPVVHAAALVVTLTFCLVNLAIDLICAKLNPQIRLA